MACCVDWGDNCIEYYTAGPVSHKYNVTEPQSFVVRISGEVTALNSSGIEVPSIIEVNQWGNTGLTSMCYAFSNNSVLQRIAENTTNSFASVRDFYSAFANCINLKEIPENLFYGCSSITSFSKAFYNCSALESIPATLFSDCTLIYDLYYCFGYCQSLKTIPESLFNKCPELHSITRLFFECRNLTSIPVNLFDNNIKIQEAEYAFANCSSLSGESPYTIIDGKKIHLYERKDALDYFLPIYNMHGMFYNYWRLLDDKDLIPDICK